MSGIEFVAESQWQKIFYVDISSEMDYRPGEPAEIIGVTGWMDSPTCSAPGPHLHFIIRYTDGVEMRVPVFDFQGKVKNPSYAFVTQQDIDAGRMPALRIR